MGEILKFPEGGNGKWCGGPAICMNCRHEWVAVAPQTAKELECPNCGTMKGIYKFPFVPEGEIWNCSCSNDLFYVTREGYFCPNCGKIQTFH